MQIPTTSDYDNIIQMLPDTPENHAAIQALLQLRSNTQVIRQPWTFEVDFSTGAGLLNGTFAAPAPGATSIGNFLVDTSAPFMLVSGTYRADLAGVAQLNATRISPNSLVLIQDQSSNRNWMNLAVPVTSIFGEQGGLPYFWPQPRLIPANTNVQVTLSNYEAANTPNVRLQFHGYRLYSLTA
jgi:hypothetical protein